MRVPTEPPPGPPSSIGRGPGSSQSRIQHGSRGAGCSAARGAGHRTAAGAGRAAAVTSGHCVAGEFCKHQKACLVRREPCTSWHKETSCRYLVPDGLSAAINCTYTAVMQYALVECMLQTVACKSPSPPCRAAYKLRTCSRTQRVHMQVRTHAHTRAHMLERHAPRAHCLCMLHPPGPRE